jgi:hypothetical protein
VTTTVVGRKEMEAISNRNSPPGVLPLLEPMGDEIGRGWRLRSIAATEITDCSCVQELRHIVVN